MSISIVQWLWVCAVVAVIIILIVYAGVSAHCRKVVIENSNKLHKQTELNERYTTELIRPEGYDNYWYTPVHYAKSLASYRNFSLESFAIQYTMKHPEVIQKLVSMNEKNIKFYENYIKACNEAEALTTNYSSHSKKCQRIEERLFLQIPKYDSPEIMFEVSKKYVSPKGRNHYGDSREYGMKECRKLLEEAEQRKRKVDRRVIERRKLTPKLRYEVLKRDHYHCVICGRGQEDGIKLHVDHIIPVSKGGKTELSNLRTLCDECNIGKSDEYDGKYDYAQ